MIKTAQELRNDRYALAEYNALMSEIEKRATHLTTEQLRQLITEIDKLPDIKESPLTPSPSTVPA